MHLRLEGYAGDDILEVCLGDTVVGFVNQTTTHSLDNVRAERSSLQAGGVCHQYLQIPLLKFLNVFLRSGVGDDNLSTQVVGQI